MKWTSNRLTVIGPQAQVRRFQPTHWERRLQARHAELLQNSPGRLVCQFDTETPPLEALRKLSRCWPGLVLLLDFECEADRLKGLAKAKAGQLEQWETRY